MLHDIKQARCEYKFEAMLTKEMGGNNQFLRQLYIHLAQALFVRIHNCHHIIIKLQKF